MDSVNLGMLLVGGIGAIGLIELIMWIVVVVRNPGLDYLRPGLVQAASTQPSAAGSSQGSHSADVRK
jgi:hypothetical protein